MSTTIKILSRNASEVLIFNAMVKTEGAEDILSIYNLVPNGDDTEAIVQVLVNGIEVPFKEAFEDSINVFVADMDAKIKEKALELITESGLDSLYSEIANAEWKIRERLDAL